MNENFLLNNSCAKSLYSAVKNLPIIDYHCHLSPKEIFEDKPFNNIGEMWLGGDHYKWRLMRVAGIDEKYITGEASYKEKFIKYAKALSMAAGNPLYHWSHMELSLYFGIDEYLTEQNAESIWERANNYIAENKLSPKKLIKQSNVSYVATTDDIVSDLSYHEKIAADTSFNTKVVPSFRTDNLLLIKRNGYLNYIKELSKITGIEIDNINSLKSAVIDRLDYFVDHGCKFSDVGIADFPNSVADDITANNVFLKVINGEQISDSEYKAFLGNMFVFLGVEYQKRNIVMQWHLSVFRNANSKIFNTLGADMGCDCIGNNISVNDVILILDKINNKKELPETILYTLNSSYASAFAGIAGSFRKVHCGAAWWFCDHKRGITDQINVIAESMNIGSFLGMLTDSRSFLSYARHDYFRRIFCSVLGEWVENGEYNGNMAETLAKAVCFENINKLVKGE